MEMTTRLEALNDNQMRSTAQLNGRQRGIPLPGLESGEEEPATGGGHLPVAHDGRHRDAQGDGAATK